MRVILSVAVFALAGFGHAIADAPFLREGTHEAPIFFNEKGMNSYFLGEDWSEDPDTLSPLDITALPREWTQGWIKDKQTFSRALVVGQPESCPLLAGIYGAPDQETAVRIAFTSCFYQLEFLEEHQKETCGCQLAMLDQVLFVRPEEFTNFSAAPAIVSFDDSRADILGIVYFAQGLLGKNQDVRLIDSDGKTRCEGTYSLNTLLFNNLKMTCDFFCKAYDGSIDIKNLNFMQREASPTAVVKSRSCDGSDVQIQVGEMARQ